MVVELISKDKNEKLQFQGSCKITIDSVSKILLVEPKNEEFKMISAMFKWKFVAEKNILFVFAEHDFQDFALIFDDTNICNKVFNVLLEKKAILGDAQLILQRFLPPFFDEISKNNGTNSKFKEILVDFINKHGEKEEYIQLLKHNNVFDLCYPDAEDKRRNLRKRQIAVAPNFQLVKRKTNGKIIQKMVLFTNDENSECFEYTRQVNDKYFVCNTCRTKHKIHVSAKIIKNDETEEECVKLGKNEHKCKPIRFVSEDAKIVKEPNFKLWEIVFGKKKVQRLTIFDSKNKKFGYVYSYNASKKVYLCLECKNKKKFITAKLLQDENGQNYVELSKTEHVCKLQKL